MRGWLLLAALVGAAYLLLVGRTVAARPAPGHYYSRGAAPTSSRGEHAALRAAAGGGAVTTGTEPVSSLPPAPTQPQPPPPAQSQPSPAQSPPPPAAQPPPLPPPPPAPSPPSTPSPTSAAATHGAGAAVAAELDALLDGSAPQAARIDALLRAVSAANARAWGEEGASSGAAPGAGAAGDVRGRLEAAALQRHWRASPADGLFVRDAATLQRRLAAAHAAHNRSCARADHAVYGHLVVRLEGRFLQEWLVYHLGWLGYEHVIVHLNPPSAAAVAAAGGGDDEGDGSLAALRPSQDAGLVSVHVHAGGGQQTILMERAIGLLHDKLCRLGWGARASGGSGGGGGGGGGGGAAQPLSALPDCERVAGGHWPVPPPDGRTVWLASHDADEFLVTAPASGEPLYGEGGDSGGGGDAAGVAPVAAAAAAPMMMCAPELVSRFAGAPGLGLNWQLFGMGGHVAEPPAGQLVVGAYQRRVRWPGGLHPQVKSIANVALALGSCGNAHCFRYRGGRLAVNESRGPIPPPSHLNVASAAQLAVFHHYDSKSLTHLAFKWLRGRASTGARHADADALARAASYVAMERQQALVHDARAAQALPFLQRVLLGDHEDR